MSTKAKRRGQAQRRRLRRVLSGINPGSSVLDVSETLRRTLGPMRRPGKKARAGIGARIDVVPAQPAAWSMLKQHAGFGGEG